MKPSPRNNIKLALTVGLGILGTLTLIGAAGPAIDKTLEDLKIITEVFDYIQKNYVIEKKPKDLTIRE